MKVKVKAWQLLLVILFVVAIPPIVWSMQTENCKGHHLTRKDFRTNIRVIFPVSILEVKGNRLNYVVSEEGLELGSFDLEEGYSIVPKDFVINGCYCITYCEKHLVVLTIDRLPQEQCKLVKN
jgi:hypothetical protein